MGEFTEDERYIPHPREVAEAEPLPQLLLEDYVVDELTDEEYGWVLVNKDTWRPRGTRGQQGVLLRDPVRLPGREYPYEAMIWNADGKIYLADALTFGLLRDSTGEMTASELVVYHFTGLVMHLPEDNPWRRALEQGYENTDEQTRMEIMGAIAAFYAQLAYLRKRGLLE